VWVGGGGVFGLWVFCLLFFEGGFLFFFCFFFSGGGLCFFFWVAGLLAGGVV